MQQALEKQIVFQDHKEAYALLGDRDEFLDILREQFAVQFISRGDQLDILGEARDVTRAVRAAENARSAALS